MNKRIAGFCLTIFTIFSLLTASFYMWSLYDLSYEKEKCNNLQSSSAYEFTNKVEIDASYNEKCYRLTHYKLIYLENLFFSIVGAFATMIFLYMIIIILDLIFTIGRLE